MSAPYNRFFTTQPPARVDVLAVLSKAADSVEDEFSHDLGMREAIAAVAELIEAAQDHADCLTSPAWSALTFPRRAELIKRYSPPKGSRPVHEASARFYAALKAGQP